MLFGQITLDEEKLMVQKDSEFSPLLLDVELCRGRSVVAAGLGAALMTCDGSLKGVVNLVTPHQNGGRSSALAANNTTDTVRQIPMANQDSQAAKNHAATRAVAPAAALRSEAFVRDVGDT